MTWSAFRRPCPLFEQTSGRSGLANQCLDCACDYDGTAGTVVSAHDILKGCDAANGSQVALQGVALILLRNSGHLLLIVQRSSLDWEDLSPKVGIPKAACSLEAQAPDHSMAWQGSPASYSAVPS